MRHARGGDAEFAPHPVHRHASGRRRIRFGHGPGAALPDHRRLSRQGERDRRRVADPRPGRDRPPDGMAAAGVRPRPDRARGRPRALREAADARDGRRRPLHGQRQRRRMGRPLRRHPDADHERRHGRDPGRVRPCRAVGVSRRHDRARPGAGRPVLDGAAGGVPLGRVHDPPCRRPARSAHAAPRGRSLVALGAARRLGRVRPADRRAGLCAGISHAEFGSLGAAPPGLRREFTLHDETAIWKQIALHTG